MMAPEDFSLQRRFRYLECAAIVLTASGQLAWSSAAFQFDEMVAVSFFFLVLTLIVSGFTPRTKLWRFNQLICQTVLVATASAIGAHHCYYVILYVLAAKAALFLSRTQMLIIAGVLIANHIVAGQFAIYAAHNIHVKVRPEPHYYRSIILEGQAALYFVIGLITVSFMGRTLVSERKNLSDAQKLEEQVENLAVKLERARIARDIHDGLGHSLTSLRIQLELVDKFLEERKNDQVRELLMRCQVSARTALQEVRRAVKTEKEGELNLNMAINELMEQIDPSGALSFEIKLDDIKLPLAVQHQLFGIVQECLTNIGKHSGATHVQIELALKEGQPSLTVRDNGKGFEIDSTNSGFGLRGLHERAVAIGGTINIKSQPGEGAEIVVCFPTTARSSPSSLAASE